MEILNLKTDVDDKNQIIHLQSEEINWLNKIWADIESELLNLKAKVEDLSSQNSTLQKEINNLKEQISQDLNSSSDSKRSANYDTLDGDLAEQLKQTEESN